MKAIFEPSDFMDEIDIGPHRALLENSSMDPEMAARFANRKIQKLIESWPVVECSLLKESNLTDQHGPGWIASEKSTRPKFLYTHKARLAFIEEMPKEECKKHLPTVKSKQVSLPMSNDPYGAALALGCEIICKHCGVELVAEWKPKPSGGVE